MKFDTYIPCDILKPHIKAFVITETALENTYKVLPGTGLVIGFQYKGRLFHVVDGQPVQLDVSGLTGLHDRYRIFKNSANTGSVLVYFYETGATAFFKQPIHEFFRESVSLDHFMFRSELLVLEERLCEAKTDVQKIDIVEKFFVARIRQVDPDPLVLQALALIHKNKGDIRIAELALQLHTSQSPLEKRFRRVTGATPKKFASIVRLKHTIGLYNPQKPLTDLGYEAGFYDQAHFIKEFKNFTGETPESFFHNK